MPLFSQFDFHHQQQQVGFFPRDLSSAEQVKWSGAKTAAAGCCEPTSVLDSRGSPTPPNSISSSFNSSACYGGAHGGGGSTLFTTQPPYDGGVKVNGSLFDQSIFGSVFNNIITMPLDLDTQHQSDDDEIETFNGFGSGHFTDFGSFENIESLFHQQQPQTIESFINHHQQLLSGFSDQSIFHLPSPKLINTVSFHHSDYQNHQNLLEKIPFFDQNQAQEQVLTTREQTQGSGSLKEMGMNQQEIFKQIFESAELISIGNLVLAHEILARLNQQLSLIGKPLQRIAYYFKESLQLLLNTSTNETDFDNSVVTSSALPTLSPPLSLILKVEAFKSFSEVSPIVQFRNFTSNQAILEAVEMYEMIHIIDFDIGYGAQWASLMQELALRNSSHRMVRLKITVFISSLDELELQLTQGNLNLFAEKLNIDLHFNVFDMDMLNSLSHYIGHNEAIAVNLPTGVFPNRALSLPYVLRVIKQLSPKIIVSSERSYDRFDLPFAHNMIQALQTYSSLLESLEAAFDGNRNSNTLQKIERFMINPMIEKLVLQRFHLQNKSTATRNVLISSGYAPLQFSNVTESQGECLIEKTNVRGFHIVKKHCELVLCWHETELVSITAWGT